MKDPIVILGAARTPLGALRGLLSGIPAPKLGATAIAGTIKQTRLDAGGSVPFFRAGNELRELINKPISTPGAGRPERQNHMSDGAGHESVEACIGAAPNTESSKNRDAPGAGRCQHDVYRQPGIGQAGGRCDGTGCILIADSRQGFG